MNSQLISGFKKRDDHLLQAAWLSSFSQQQNKERLRESPLYVYNIKGNKYLYQPCCKIMLSEHLIENYIDDLYVNEIEEDTSDIIKGDYTHLGEYIIDLIRIYSTTGNVNKDKAKFLLKFISLLDCRNKFILIDNAYKLAQNKNKYLQEVYSDSDIKNYIKNQNVNTFNINDNLDLLFLSNCLIKTRFNKVYNFFSHSSKKLNIRLVEISNRIREGKKINGLALMGENPVMNISSLHPEDQAVLKNQAMEISQNEELIQLHWNKFSCAYILPLSWQHMILLYEIDKFKDINDEDHEKLMRVAISIYEEYQVLSCNKELIINPDLYNDKDLEKFIQRIVNINTNLNNCWLTKDNIYSNLKSAIK